jgi:hypothetical protein
MILGTFSALLGSMGGFGTAGNELSPHEIVESGMKRISIVIS